MSLMQIFDIAGSGLAAQTVRLNATTSNIANADSVASSIERTYRAREPVFATALQGFNQRDQAGVGVRVAGIVESNAPLRKEYMPGHPMADEQGYITLPNVNPVEEMANLIAASRSFQTNLEAVNVSKQLLQQTLRMGE